MDADLPRVPVEGLRADATELPASAGHYVARVLRLRRGDRVRLFDPVAGVEADAEVLGVDGGQVRIACGPLLARGREGRRVALVQGLGKGDKLDAIVRDATELGVSEVWPVLTARTVVQPGPKSDARVERWRRIAIEAARQCGRAQAPSVHPILALDEACGQVEAALRLVLSPSASRRAGPLLLGASSSVALVVGPEGGLTAQEIEALRGRGWLEASLGATVLRTETVAAAVLGALMIAEGGPPEGA